ncbi:D-hexose-6-phosphate mutarotase [Sessilibacter sp. MAH4]
MSSDLATTLQTLYARFGELPGVQIEIHKSLPAITVTNDKAVATVFLQGAQVSEYQRHGEKPTLFLSSANRFLPDVPLRGGIPICWPWFGDLKRNPAAISQQVEDVENAPAHGFVRNLQWQLHDIVALPNETTLTLSLDVTPQTYPAWPYQARLSLEVRVGESLKLTLSVTNTGLSAFQYSLALHSYLAVDNVEKCYLTGLEDTVCFNAAENWLEQSQDDALNFTEETDLVCPTGPSTVHLIEEDQQGRIDIHSHNLPSWVIWNPWVDKSQRLSDFNPQDYQKMVCVESASLLDNAPELAAGQTVRHYTQITHSQPTKI